MRSSAPGTAQHLLIYWTSIKSKGPSVANLSVEKCKESRPNAKGHMPELH